MANELDPHVSQPSLMDAHIDEATRESTLDPESHTPVPTLSYSTDAVYEMIENSPWRKAFFIDGQMRWATSNGDGIGDFVGGDHPWNFRQIGDEFYLAPKEDTGIIDSVKAENDKRVNTFLEKVVADMTSKSTDESLPRSVLLQRLTDWDAILSNYTRDGVLATDVHGYVDNDFDNTGPRLNRVTQAITRGYYSLKTRNKDPVFQRLAMQREQILMPLDTKEFASGDAADQGYDSGASDVSVDRCRESPAYPKCDVNCWLKQAYAIPGPTSRAIDQPRTISISELHDIYTPLRPGFTRILTIHPGAMKEQIRCTLEPMEILGAHDIDDNQHVEPRRYEALSYTWGDASKCHTIQLEGKDFGVSQNLYNALRNVRLPDRSRTLWIDALCINQLDNAERSEQVQYMFAIYGAATRVIVWLGCEYDDSDFVMDAMGFIGNRKNRADIMRCDHSHDCLVQLARVINGIEALTRRGWFFRTWIRQEVSAARQLIVRRGSKELPWTIFKRSVNSLSRLRDKYTASKSLFLGDESSFLNLIHPSFERSYALKFLKKDWVIGQSLLAESGDLGSIWYYHTGGMLDLLITGRAYEAKDARDKVYAILGMAEVHLSGHQRPSTSLQTTHGGNIESPVMRIDYSSSVSEVYQYTAKYLINRDRNLDVLCILPTQGRAESDDLPSWTPDWRTPLSSVGIYDNWDYISYKWGAAGFSKAEVQDQSDINHLNVKGFEVARIQKLLPLFPVELPHPPETPAGPAVTFEEGQHNRRFAQSSRGPAIVPPTARIDDAIWILLGCRMPVVLRPCTETLGKAQFEVLGPCWVSTIMFGEALEWLAELQHELEVVSVVLV
ncbi:hypothetical protein E8E14_001199 [Neopestalotiopsis sp. 37M]|nr:hypothetical protein E8E14_001199 [Neopestalotiopsis sp. 37M]